MNDVNKIGDVLAALWIASQALAMTGAWKRLLGDGSEREICQYTARDDNVLAPKGLVIAEGGVTLAPMVRKIAPAGAGSAAGA